MAQAFVTEHRDYLKRELATRIKRRPLYSQRAFARDIGLSPSSLTDYLKGNMRLSPARVGQLGKSLGLTGEQTAHWNDLVESKFAKSESLRQLSQLRANNRIQAQAHSISLDEFKLVSEWFHMAYLELILMDAPKYSDLKIAARALQVPVRSLRVAVKRLEKLGLLKRNANTGHAFVDSSVQLGDTIPSAAIRQYHQQILQKAAASIETHDFHQRFNSSTMVVLPQAEVTKILKDIESLALRFLEPYMIQAQNKPKERLYCLTLQFFDLLNQEKTP